MNIHAIKENKTMGLKVDTEEVVIGQKYRVIDVIERGMYRGKLNTYFIEYVYESIKAHLMTRADGSKPFAIATNDCERDGFGPYELSKILVEEGNNVVFAHRKADGRQFDPLQFIVFQVTDINPEEKYGLNSLEVEATHKFDSLNIPPQFIGVGEHAISVISSNNGDQLLPKYCFNPNRLITLRLFETNEKDEVESYLDDKRLILNANSKERLDLCYGDDSNQIVSGGLLRVFFSRKFKDSKHIFVDGKCLKPLRKWDLEAYIENSHLDSEIAQSTIKEIITRNNQRYYVTTNLHGDIRPIYKSITGYSSFALNMNELSFIKEVKDITSWV